MSDMITAGSADRYLDLPAVVDVDGAAAILGVHPQTVRRMISDGRLGHVRLGRLYRVPRHYLTAFLAGAPPSVGAATRTGPATRGGRGDGTDEPPTRDRQAHHGG